jgi:hypothetical protein
MLFYILNIFIFLKILKLKNSINSNYSLFSGLRNLVLNFQILLCIKINILLFALFYSLILSFFYERVLCNDKNICI